MVQRDTQVEQRRATTHQQLAIVRVDDRQAARAVRVELDRVTVQMINGIPLANNADGIIYNVDLFEELGLSVPTTWDELIYAAEEIQAAGLVPFYHTWQEAWTTLPPFNPLAQNVPPEDFWELRWLTRPRSTEEYPEVAERLLELTQYGPDDPFRFGYNTGNRAIADGDAVMYLQGIWAIPTIRRINPDVNLSVFPFPHNQRRRSQPPGLRVDIL
jgi:raffinose/stachyose/melibiose transport system substrate-binding protein